MPKSRGQRGRLRDIIATVAVATVVVAGAALIPGAVTTSPPPSEGTANLWVDTNGGTCTRVSPADSYSDALACGSFNSAYQAASSGDTIRVRAGAYGSQTISVSSPNKTSTVLLEPETESTVVSVTAFTISGADWLTVSGIVNTTTQTPFAMDDDVSGNDPDHNTFLDVEGPWFDIRDGTFNTVQGGDYGDCVADASNGCTARLIGTNQTVDGVTLHDITSSDATSFHPDGIFLRGCTNCTIKNSTFYNNQIVNIRVQNCCSNPPNSNITIENNWLAPPWSTSSLTGMRHNGIDIDTETPGLIIRFNSFASWCESGGTCGAYVSANGAFGTAASPAQFYGNLIGRAGCGSNVDWSYNVWKKFSAVTGASCDATEVQSTSLFPYTTEPQGPGAIDYTIIGTSWAGDEMVPSTLCDDVPTDKNGNSRNDGNGCDAGAVER